MDYIKADADGAGTTLIQQVQEAVSQDLLAGRFGLLTDYPATERTASKADMRSGAVAATVTLYNAPSIINWRTTKVGGKSILSLVVLLETHDEPDGYGIASQTQYRELALDNGVYTVRIWRQEAGKDWVVADTYSPRNGSGKPWTEIPFAFGGAVSNRPDIGPVPMYDLAALNLAHYRNSADFEDSVWFAGQPQFWMSGLDQNWLQELDKRGLYVGSRAVLPLPVNGDAGVLQAESNTLAREAMKDKQEQMAAIGARLLERGGAVQTAYETQSDDATAHSVLSLVCDNVSAAYTLALQWACEMMNTPDEDAALSIPTEFVTDTLDAQMLTALLAAVQAGKLPETDYWAKLRESGLIDAEKTDDEIREEVSSQGGSVAGIDDLTNDDGNPAS
jgi:hypothetical protein